MRCVDQTHFVVCAINVQATEWKKKIDQSYGNGE